MESSTALADLRLHSTGKVREMYEVDGDLLMVASDRISAYDVIMPNPIPDKGRVLNKMSVFWFKSTGDLCPNHLLSEEVPEEVAGRAIQGSRAVVIGRASERLDSGSHCGGLDAATTCGSAWDEGTATSTVRGNGIRLCEP